MGSYILTDDHVNKKIYSNLTRNSSFSASTHSVQKAQVPWAQPFIKTVSYSVAEPEGVYDER